MITTYTLTDEHFRTLKRNLDVASQLYSSGLSDEPIHFMGRGARRDYYHFYRASLELVTPSTTLNPILKIFSGDVESGETLKKIDDFCSPPIKLTPIIEGRG